MEKTNSSRERMIQTTWRLMDRNGYHGTGLNEIIKECGAPRGSLYYYFPNGKEQLVAETIAEIGYSIAGRIRMAVASVEDPAEAIHMIFVNLAKKMEESICTQAGFIASVTLETSNSSELLQRSCKDMYGSLKGIFEELFVTRGFSLDRAASLATFITASMEGGVILSRANRTSQPLKQIAEELKQMLIQARQ
jgi:TetR/AcrR family transcriptional repressor of lmrAB and yxaGH operons